MKGIISKSKLSNAPPIIKYTKKNTKIGIYQSANQKPNFSQFVFEHDPHIPQWSRHFVDPAFFNVRPHSMGETPLFCVLEKHLKKNGLESPLIFVLFLRGKTK